MRHAIKLGIYLVCSIVVILCSAIARDNQSDTQIIQIVGIVLFALAINSVFDYLLDKKSTTPPGDEDKGKKESEEQNEKDED